MKTAVIGVSFLFVLGTVWATPDATHSTSEEVATPLPIAGGVYEINVASNVTVTYSGAITGEGGIRKSGAGTLVLSNGGNSFEGGVEIVEGVLRVDAAGSIGTGLVHICGDLRSAADKKYAVTRTISFNVADATFANNFLIEGREPKSHAPFIRAQQSVTLAGRVDLKAAVVSDSYIVFTSGATSADQTTKTLKFTGGVYATSTYFRPFSYGSIWFACPFVLPGTISCPGSGYPGDLRFDGVGSFFSQLIMNGNRIVCGADFVFTNGVVKVGKNANNTDTMKTRLDLDGHSQAFAAFDYDTTQKTGANPSADADGSWVYTPNGRPATVTLIGAAKSYTGWQRFYGPISLVVDAANHPGFVQTLSYRAHTMTGVLAVSNGTLVANNNTTFKNVSEVHVGPHGKLVATGSTGAFTGLAKLVVDGTNDLSGATAPFVADNSLEIYLGPEASLVLPGNIRVKNVFVWDGAAYQPLANGDYAAGAISQISGGAVNVDNGEDVEVDATWTAGGGATNRSVAEASNWSDEAAASALTTGKLGATFASGGSVAEIDRAVKFRQLTFSKADGFTLASSGASAAVELEGGGLAVTGGGTNEIAPPLALPVEQTWAVGADSALVLSGGVTTGDGYKLFSGGEGAIAFAGESVFGGGAEISNKTVTVAGTIATPGHVDQGVPRPWKAGGYDVNANAFRIICTQAGGSVTFDDAFVEKPLWIRGVSATEDEPWLSAAPGSTNVFAGSVYLEAPIGDLTLPSDAALVFSNATTFGGLAHFRRGTIRIAEGGTFNCGTGSGLYLYSGARLELAGKAEGKFRFSGGAVELFDGGSITNATGYLTASSSLTLNGHDVHFVFFDHDWGTFTISSTAPARFIVGYDGNNPHSDVSASTFVGCISFVKNGAGGSLTLKAGGYASTGDLTVEGSGTMVLADGATWRNGTNVNVRGSGVLRLDGRRQFNGQVTVLNLAGSGVVQVADGTTQRVHAMTVDGAPVPPGLYGSADAPGVDTTYAAHFTGTGVVRVGSPGAMLIIR